MLRESLPVEELLARQMNAQTVVLVTPEPLEVRKHPRAEDFQRAMCRSLTDDGRYIFVLDNTQDEAASEQWRVTLAALERTLAADNENQGPAADLLAKWEQTKKIVSRALVTRGMIGIAHHRNGAAGKHVMAERGEDIQNIEKGER